MISDTRERLQIWLLLLSAVAWILLAVEPRGMAHAAMCSMAMPVSAPSSLNRLLADSPPALLATEWALMLTAMMVPLLMAPVRHVRESSFTSRRVRAIALFVTGYGAIWMAAGVLLVSLTLAVRLVVPGLWMPLALVAVVAIMWQSSPTKQRCLNRNHAHSELAAFGWAADFDALRFGLTHGVWCFGSCWALMLLPLLVPRGQLAAMAAVALWLLGERLDRPMPPRWGWRGPSKAARIVVAQTRMWLQLQRS
jgi:predicted metal-binding membrane protein